MSVPMCVNFPDSYTTIIKLTSEDCQKKALLQKVKVKFVTYTLNNGTKEGELY